MSTTFLIQTVKNKVEHDFSHTLIDTIEYQTWLDDGFFNDGGNKPCDILYSDNPVKIDDAIPVGSVEFVLEFMRLNNIKQPKPLNVPEELLHENFSGRKIWNMCKNDNYCNPDCKQYYMKSNDIIKHYDNGIIGYSFIDDFIKRNNAQISEIIDIQSEYRCFVFKNELVGLKHYSGDFTIFPNIKKINEIISSFTKQPIAWTLDVGVNYEHNHSLRTFVIECHDFFSCGLYGFNGYNLIPQMFIQWFNQYKESVKQ